LVWVKIFLAITPKAQAEKAKTNEQDYIIYEASSQQKKQVAE
jgi:hypothetical protein